MTTKHSNRSDLLRLREILQILIRPFQDMTFLTTEDKLVYAIRPSDYPIYRRKILQTIKIRGLWWMGESQWVRYLWHGHGDVHVIKSGQDPDRVLATRSFNFYAGANCYVREMPDRVDLEAMSSTKKWDKIKKKDKGTVREWMTVTITKEEYQKLLDSHLGPKHDEI